MPKTTQITKYVCNYTSRIFDTEEEAKQSELQFKLDRFQKQIDFFLPVQHDNDSKYKKHCVACGKLLKVWEREWDGIDKPQRGKLIEDVPARIFIQGLRCVECYEKIVLWVVSALKEKHEKDNNAARI
jgi:hypothetical protein